MNRTCSISLFAVVIIGCTTAGRRGETGAAPDHVAEYDQIYCARMFECGQSRNVEMYGTSPDECFANQREYRAMRHASLTAGRIVYNADDAAACRTGIAAAACDVPDFSDSDDTVLWYRVEACRTQYAGTLQSGQACTMFDDCVDGESLECDRATMTCGPM